MTTTTENLAAALRALLDEAPAGTIAESVLYDKLRGMHDALPAARDALAQYDAEQADRADETTAENARGAAQAYLNAVLEQGEYAVTDGPVTVQDPDDPEARTYAVPVLIYVSADDAEPGSVDDDTRSNGPRR